MSDINNIIFRILDLQKDRYFETLSATYWNQTLKTHCPNSDDNEGITLESLGSHFLHIIKLDIKYNIQKKRCICIKFIKIILFEIIV